MSKYTVEETKDFYRIRRTGDDSLFANLFKLEYKPSWLGVESPNDDLERPRVGDWIERRAAIDSYLSVRGITYVPSTFGSEASSTSWYGRCCISGGEMHGCHGMSRYDNPPPLEEILGELRGLKSKLIIDEETGERTCVDMYEHAMRLIGAAKTENVMASTVSRAMTPLVWA